MWASAVAVKSQGKGSHGFLSPLKGIGSPPLLPAGVGSKEKQPGSVLRRPDSRGRARPTWKPPGATGTVPSRTPPGSCANLQTEAKPGLHRAHQVLLSPPERRGRGRARSAGCAIIRAGGGRKGSTERGLRLRKQLGQGAGRAGPGHRQGRWHPSPCHSSRHHRQTGAQSQALPSHDTTSDPSWPSCRTWDRGGRVRGRHFAEGSGRGSLPAWPGSRDFYWTLSLPKLWHDRGVLCHRELRFTHIIATSTLSGYFAHLEQSILIQDQHFLS